MALRADTIREFGELFERDEPPRAQTHRAVVTAVDGGTVYVDVSGSGEPTPIETASAGYAIGDEVQVEQRGGRLHVSGNVTQPSVGAQHVEQAVAPVARTAAQAQSASQSAKRAADEAAEVANAVNQHFFSDTDGVHVTDNEQDDWEEEYDKTGHGELDNPTAQKPWHNILMNSLGILLRTGLRNLVSITQTAVGFFDGRGNAAGNVVASFGREGAIVGKTAGLHTEVTSSGIAMKDGNTTLCSFGTNATMDIANIQTLNVGSAVAESIITQSLNAQSSTIGALQADTAKVHSLTAQELSAATAYVGALTTGNVTAQNIIADHGNFATVQANAAKVANLTAAELEADHATVGSLSTNYAQISGANITNLTAQNGWLDKIMVQTGLLSHSGTIYSLDAIQVNASKITAGTLDVERLIVTQNDQQGNPQKYLIHVDTSGSTPVTTYEKLDGNVIEDLTITADKIVAGAITADKITTQNIVGTGGWINLHNGTFAYSSPLTGQGISWDGSNLSIVGSVTVGGSSISLNQFVEDSINLKIEEVYDNLNPHQSVTLNAHVYRGATEITSQYSANAFAWYIKKESTVAPVPLNPPNGYSHTLSVSEADFGAAVVCNFTPPNDASLLTEDDDELTDSNDEPLSVRTASGDHVRVSDLTVTTTVFGTDKLMVVGSEDEHLVTVSTLQGYLEANMPKQVLFGTTSQWSSQTTLVSEENVIYIYTDHGTDQYGNPLAGIKVGDGSAYVVDLPFTDAVMTSHMSNTDIHITAAERAFWNNKVRAYYTGNEQLVLTTN